tara:strand:- start:33 stop:431 length:399 start_codon:yes stop_codon:yes gene_type:complete
MDTMEDTLKYRLGDVEHTFKEFGITPVFDTVHGRGLHAKLGNYTVSCQWHDGAYCDNRWAENPDEFCNNFELGIWEFNSDKWVPLRPYDEEGADPHTVGFIEWDKLVPILCVVLHAHTYNKPELLRTIGSWA